MAPSRRPESSRDRDSAAAADHQAHRRRSQQHQHGQPSRTRGRAPAVIERSFEADVHVRGNRITLTASPARSRWPSGCSTSWSPCSAPARASPPDAVERILGMLRAETDGAPGRRALAEHPVHPRPHDPAQDAEPEAVRRRDRQAHHRVRHRPGRHRQDLPGDGQGGAGAAGQAGQPDHPDPPGGRGRRAARIPAGTLCEKIDPTCDRSTTRCTTCSTPSRSRG